MHAMLSYVMGVIALVVASTNPSKWVILVAFMLQLAVMWVFHFLEDRDERKFIATKTQVDILKADNDEMKKRINQLEEIISEKFR